MSTRRSPRGRIVVSAACDFCDACAAVCPPACLVITEREWSIDAAACTMCGQCVVVCPVGALQAVGVVDRHGR